MKILITNDDGINSPGLQKLAFRLRKEHDVWVVAPRDEKSACSHSLTLHNTIKLKKTGDQDYSCWGTPVDCVLTAILGIVPGDIDMVISGPNLGPNIGTDVIYSGTAAGARQAALMGKPAVAASIFTYSPPYNCDFPVEFIARNCLNFKNSWTPDHFLNINFPNNINDRAEVSITTPSKRLYKDKLTTYEAPDGCLYTFIVGDGYNTFASEADDYSALQQNKIAISPVFLFPQSPEDWQKYKKIKYWEG